MNNTFKIEYSQEFYNDLKNILNYINIELKNNIAAKNLLDKIEKSIINRAKNPLNYQAYTTNSSNIYYRIYINNYIIFYTVHNQTMFVRRLIYKSRNFNDLI